MAKSKVVIRHTDKGLRPALEAVLQSLSWEKTVFPGARVVIKPNYCTAIPEKVEAANTSFELLKTFCEILKSRTSNITIGESAGPRHSAEEAFIANNASALRDELGVSILDFEKDKRTTRDIDFFGEMELPETLLKADVFITLPKLKTHALTYFTGSLKNQWGCVPNPRRILFHMYIDRLLVELNRIFRPQLCIMDGITGMENRGPTNGTPRSLGLVLGSNDPVALDATAMRLAGLDVSRARHIVLAGLEGLGETDERNIELDMDGKDDIAPFEPARFDWALKAMNYMTRYEWFVKNILLNDRVFIPTKKAVNVMRKLGIVR
ncbi:MAG TPA: DUF362 domain-containing protein [Nitrospirota bacterium]|nr:DUF362 domain-containing protein [Nitrospirota bacterium]